MVSRNRLALGFGLTFALLAVACGDAPASNEGAGRFAGTGENDDTSASSPSTDTDGTDPTTESSNAATPSGDDDSDDAGTSPYQATDPDGGSGGDSGTPVAPDPDPSRTCHTAKDLGAVSGDTDNGQVTAQGSCSDWVKIRLTEDDHAIFANDMKVTATLVSPPGDDFDLFVYVNETTDLLECTTATGNSTLASGHSDTVKLAWGEGWTANDADDSRTVSFEVRHKTSGCSTGSWTLLIQGNDD